MVKYCRVPARWGLLQTHPGLRAATRHGIRDPLVRSQVEIGFLNGSHAGFCRIHAGWRPPAVMSSLTPGGTQLGVIMWVHLLYVLDTHKMYSLRLQGRWWHHHYNPASLGIGYHDSLALMKRVVLTTTPTSSSLLWAYKPTSHGIGYHVSLALMKRWTI